MQVNERTLHFLEATHDPCSAHHGPLSLVTFLFAFGTFAAWGTAAIVGALVYDSNNHPYYVRNNRRYYVTQQEAGYYRSHHQGVERRAYVPEREYPVQRDPYHNR